MCNKFQGYSIQYTFTKMIDHNTYFLSSVCSSFHSLFFLVTHFQRRGKSAFEISHMELDKHMKGMVVQISFLLIIILQFCTEIVICCVILFLGECV